MPSKIIKAFFSPSPKTVSVFLFGTGGQKLSFSNNNTPKMIKTKQTKTKQNKNPLNGANGSHNTVLDIDISSKADKGKMCGEGCLIELDTVPEILSKRGT